MRIFALLSLLAAFSNQASAAIDVPMPDVYKASGEQVLLNRADLALNCTKISSDFKECTWSKDYGLITEGAFTLSPEYRASATSGIAVEGVFARTEGGIFIEIDGIRMPVRDGNGQQFFVFPATGSEQPKVRIGSSFEGVGDVELDYQAVITKITVKIDNSHVVDRNIANARAAIKATSQAVETYTTTKDALSYMNQSTDTLKILKPFLTGREVSDLSDDCGVNAQGAAAPINPIQCTKLKIINGVLRGDQPTITAANKIQAFEDLTKAVRILTAYKVYLEAAHQDTADAIAALNNADTAIKAI